MKRNFGENYKVAYASKALCARFLYPILASEGIHADVVSGGELYTALKAGFNPKHLHFHGNNKTVAELEMAVECGIGSIITPLRAQEEGFFPCVVGKEFPSFPSHLKRRRSPQERREEL